MCNKEQIMKKIKFIPALAMVALLSACGTKSNLFKAPKFVKEGASIEKDTFVTEINTAVNASVYKGEEVITRSFICTASYGSESITTINKDGKKYGEQLQQRIMTASLKADIKNYAAHMEGEQVDYMKATQGNVGGMEMKNVQKHDMYLQTIMFEGQETMGEVIKSEKMFIPLTPLSEENPVDKVFDSMIKSFATSEESPLGVTGEFVESVENMDEAMLEKVSFFKNNNIYTLVFEETLNPDPELDDENNLIKKVETKNSQKVQITLQGSDCKFVSYGVTETTTTYFQDSTYSGMTLNAGDSVVEKSTSIENSNIYVKNVTVKPVSIDDCLLGSMI